MKSFRTNPLSRQNKRITGLIACVVLFTACSQSGQFPVLETSQSLGNDSASVPPIDTGGGSDVDPGTPVDPTPPTSVYKMSPLVWESSSHPERTQWSEYLQNIISTDWKSLLTGASDMTTFCPKYDSLNDDQKANAWAQLFAGIAKFESGWSPTSRMQETTMGTDPVTGLPIYSEGLLQLSYQDTQWATWCQFDWSADKSLSVSSSKKTILDPYLNLYCGVGIMARQIKNKGRIVISSGVYWAVIRSGGTYQHINEIASIVSALPICK